MKKLETWKNRNMVIKGKKVKKEKHEKEYKKLKIKNINRNDKNVAKKKTKETRNRTIYALQGLLASNEVRSIRKSEMYEGRQA
jgi:hypothetical protein